MKNKTSKAGIVFFIIALILSVGVGVFEIVYSIKHPSENSISISNSKELFQNNQAFSFPFRKNEVTVTKVPKSEYIAKLVIAGTIEKENMTYNQQWLLSTVKKLQKDSKNKGIILFIDSPGGTVYEADELYLALQKYKEETKRPVYAYFGSLAASGGYYIGCSADYIMANRNTITGSIGVISGQFVDITKLMEKYGVKVTTIHSGKNKAMGSLGSSVTDEQIAIMQAISDECYEQFTNIVSKARNIPLSDVKKLADGRVYTAKQAVQNKLIDSTGDFDLCKEIMCSKCFENKQIEAVTFEYKRAQTFYDYFMNAASTLKGIKTNSELPNVIEEALTEKIKFPAYYYSK